MNANIAVVAGICRLKVDERMQRACDDAGKRDDRKHPVAPRFAAPRSRTTVTQVSAA
jgi:hypothetical protein